LEAIFPTSLLPVRAYPGLLGDGGAAGSHFIKVLESMRRAINFIPLMMIVTAVPSAQGWAENRIDVVRADAPALAAYGGQATGVRTLEFVNPDQVDIKNLDPKSPRPAALPRYDRPLTVEVWYPAERDAKGPTTLKAFIRDGKTEVTLQGRSVRDMEPAKDVVALPLVIISHGYPGNRYLLSPLAENIASKGYVVAAIDHTDSTYRTKTTLSSSLVNRPLDQLFVLEQIAKLSHDPTSFLNGKVDANNAAIIGYSMGGYGAVISAGGGLTQKAADSVDYPFAAPWGTLMVHKSGGPSHDALFDPRVKTAIAFAPWGMIRGFFDAVTLKGIKIPMLFVAGSADDIAGYENGVRATWRAATGVDRALLTFENANHNAGAVMPPPKEADMVDKDLGFNLTNHYIDAVWDNVRMNNVSQHFVTAWLGKYLKSDPKMDAYLNLVVEANSGVWAVDESGAEKPEHTYWKGFPNRTAKGLRFERLKTGE
jgi:predicted dienelactone hydrolase